MRYIYLANNRVGLEVLRWLKQQEDQLVGLVVHPVESAKYRTEIIKASGLELEQVREGPVMKTEAGKEWAEALAPELMVSVYFGYILPKEIIDVPHSGAVNLHPAYLPYNRGAYPNVWSIVDGTPAGVTLHYMDHGIDTGAIIGRRQVSVEPIDTGATLHRKLELAAMSLFRDMWPVMRSGNIPSHSQQGAGTSHRVADVDRIDRIDPNASYRAGDLIDILRARTFAPYKGAYIEQGGKSTYVRVELWQEPDDPADPASTKADET